MPLTPFIRSAAHLLAQGSSSTYFSGTNCYYLPYSTPAEIDALLDDALALRLTAIRTWAFLDENKNGVQFHSWDPTTERTCCSHGPDGLQRLDYLIASAAVRKIKLLLPLVNNWDDFGGRKAYCSWFGLAEKDDFYESPLARQAYRNWVSELLGRVNSITGVPYRHEPAILGWELANEVRCARGVPTLLRWVDEMSHHVKSAAPNQMVGLGDEGFFNRGVFRGWLYDGSCGYDFDAFLKLPAVDFAGFHLYPETWGHGASPQAALDFGRRWIEDHADAAHKTGKPVLLEEYGLRQRAWREDIYPAWVATARAAGVAADLFWMLGSRMDGGDLYPDFDGFTVYRDHREDRVCLT